MIIDDTIQKHYNSMLLARNAEKEATHEPSGKLSASMLYQPLRFQVLKSIGAPRKPMEAYTLGKFDRGDEVEAKVALVTKDFGALVEQQKFVEYREAIGYVDMVVNTDLMPYKMGLMPWEIKSVTNAKLKRINVTGVDYHYQMQACFYALAMGLKHYAVVIASGEDNRMTTYVYPVESMQREVDHAIGEYMKAMEEWRHNQVLPKFAPNPKVPWTSNIQYAMFTEEWVSDDKWAITQLETLGII